MPQIKVISSEKDGAELRRDEKGYYIKSKPVRKPSPMNEQVKVFVSAYNKTMGETIGDGFNRMYVGQRGKNLTSDRLNKSKEKGMKVSNLNPADIIDFSNPIEKLAVHVATMEMIKFANRPVHGNEQEINEALENSVKPPMFTIGDKIWQVD